MKTPKVECKGCDARDRLNQTFAVRVDELERFVSSSRTQGTSQRNVSQSIGSREIAREISTKKE